MASRHLDIDCGNCGTFIVRYRKEGSGQLIRLYLDKVLQPKSLVALKSNERKSNLPVLTYPKCSNPIGHPMEHKGNHLAYRMIKGSFKKSSN